ncbi:MAG: hypothetical protein DLM63_11690 [Solirubrobacterales bacterium]|nr:MAG: hypothetical protein DLM63_11690 [Solirubrobacterales bacterium]
MTRGALYYNFPAGKEDLFLALLDARVEQRADSIRASFAAPGGTLETAQQARAAADDAFAAVRPNREWRLLTFELALHAARDGAFAQRYAEREDTIRQAIEEVVRARVEQFGAQPPLSPRDLATGLNALGNGLALDALTDDNAVSDGLFGRLVGFLVRGIFAAAEDQQTNGRTR